MLMAARNLSSSGGLAVCIQQIDTQSCELMGLLPFYNESSRLRTHKISFKSCFRYSTYRRSMYSYIRVGTSQTRGEFMFDCFRNL
jgi:hypothetical protein